MLLSKSVANGVLSHDEIRQLIAQAAAELKVDGKRVLTIIPDGTRSMPMPLIFPGAPPRPAGRGGGGEGPGAASPLYCSSRARATCA